MKPFSFLFVSLLFTLSIDAQYTMLHQFSNSVGGEPSGLILLGDSIYGTTKWGGNNGSGTLYRIHPNGTGFTVLHHFLFDGASSGTELANIDDTLFGVATSSFIGKELLYRINKDGSFDIRRR